MLKSKYNKRKRIRTAAVLIIGAALMIAADLSLTKAAAAFAKQSAARHINQQIAACIDRCLQGRELFVPSNNNNQTIISSNDSELSFFKAEVVQMINDHFADESNLSFTVKLGSLTGSHFLQNRGPDIKISFAPVTNVSAAVKSDLSSAGINQTKYTVTMYITADTDILLAGKLSDVAVSSEYMLHETVIAGDVPNTYFGL